MPDPIKVFVSSTCLDLDQYRERAKVIIEKKLKLECIGMEDKTQSGERETPEDVSMKWVEESDWVVVIVGWHYGTLCKDRLKSIVELEYDSAMHHHKPCFVYVANESANPREGYKQASWERKNLLEYKSRFTRRMRSFRKLLLGRHGKQFRNIKHFCDLLGEDLEDRLNLDLKPPVGKSGDPVGNFADVVNQHKLVREWFRTITPIYRYVIELVKMLAVCKEIHDVLHHLRHQSITLLYDSVLPGWDSNKGKRRKLLDLALTTKNVKLGELGTYTKRLQEYEESCLGGETRPNTLLLTDLQKYIAFGTGHLVKAKFTRELDKFARAVEEAFKEMNNAMQDQREAYKDAIQRISEDLDRSAPSLGLSPSDMKELKDRLDVLMGLGRHLVQVMIYHNRWQTLHDDLVRIQSASGKKTYPREICSFITKNQPQLEKLYMRSQAAIEAAPDGAMDVAPARSERFKGNGETMLSRAGDLWKKYEPLREAKMKSLDRADVRLFTEMRKSFDEVFFCFDLTVLDVVTRARKRAENASEALLNISAGSPSSGASDSTAPGSAS